MEQNAQNFSDMQKRISGLEAELSALRKGQAVVTREYKSRLFSFLFGQEENKGWTLSLYNAMHGTNYTNPDDIQITTIGNFIWMGMKNDLSYIVANTAGFYRTMNIHEQQSTWNSNMPLREFIYSGRLYEKLIAMQNG